MIHDLNKFMPKNGKSAETSLDAFQENILQVVAGTMREHREVINKAEAKFVNSMSAFAESEKRMDNFKVEVADAVTEIVQRLQAVETKLANGLSGETRVMIALEALKLPSENLSVKLAGKAGLIILEALSGRATDTPQATEERSDEVPGAGGPEASAVSEPVPDAADAPGGSEEAPHADAGAGDGGNH